MPCHRTLSSIHVSTYCTACLLSADVACMRWRLTAAAGVVSFFRGLGRGGQLLVLALLAVVLVEVRSDQMMSTGAGSAASS